MSCSISSYPTSVRTDLTNTVRSGIHGGTGDGGTSKWVLDQYFICFFLLGDRFSRKLKSQMSHKLFVSFVTEINTKNNSTCEKGL